MKEALYWESLDDNRVACALCPHGCRILEGAAGICRVRRNVGGKLYSVNYAQVSSISMDPIKKKPLYNFYPESKILSVGTFGCNLRCSFCQNWTIAHADPKTMHMSSEELVKEALSLKADGNIGIAFTYNEPSIWYEFIFETVKISKEVGLKNVLVTNGFINNEPLNELLPYIDAMNIDVKGFTDKFYSKICKGTLEDVKKTVETSAKKCHVEVTTLIIPDLNDSVEEIDKLASWLASIDNQIPLHLTRYFPNYEMRNKPPTPIDTLEKLKSQADKYLKYVYLGNV
jgi:pyruvate formate lyase activating enzyme